jgi:hypothetical protein
MRKRRNLKKFWEEQRQKEREQVRPLAEKIAKAIVKCSEVIEQETKQENFNREIEKFRSNFNYQLKMRGINIEH